MRSSLIAVPLTILLLASSSASAQDQPSFMADLVKKVIFDPTTYAPAGVAWEAARLDWRSSQVFFQHGFVERNPGFTVSGNGDDKAIGYTAGNRQILIDAVGNLQLSVVNNVFARVTERLLMPRYPNHRTLLRRIGWIERNAMASYLSYRLSAGHLRQWRQNERLAHTLGY
jgi:hypothetical protein